MNTPILRIAGAIVLVIMGIWAGASLHFAGQGARSGREAPRGLGVETPQRVDAPQSLGVKVPAGEASAPIPGDTSDDVPLPPKIPDRLPQFSLEDRAGKSTPISAFAGKSLIINFWATWCAPCRSEIPLLESVHSEWSARGISVIGIAVDHRDQVLQFADRFKISYPLLIGEQDALDAATAFGVVTPVFPFTVFTDRRGDVVALFVGELHRPEAELILSQVQSLNENRVQLPAARQAITEGLHALQTKRPG